MLVGILNCTNEGRIDHKCLKLSRKWQKTRIYWPTIHEEYDGFNSTEPESAPSMLSSECSRHFVRLTVIPKSQSVIEPAKLILYEDAKLDAAEIIVAVVPDGEEFMIVSVEIQRSFRLCIESKMSNEEMSDRSVLSQEL